MLIMITENNNMVLIKLAWLFLLLLVTATFAQQLPQEESNDESTTSSTSSEPSLVSSPSTLPSFAEPLSHVPEPNSGFGQDFQKAKLGFDALKVGKQHADRLEDKLPKVAYSR